MVRSSRLVFPRQSLLLVLLEQCHPADQTHADLSTRCRSLLVGHVFPGRISQLLPPMDARAPDLATPTSRCHLPRTRSTSNTVAEAPSRLALTQRGTRNPVNPRELDVSFIAAPTGSAQQAGLVGRVNYSPGIRLAPKPTDDSGPRTFDDTPAVRTDNPYVQMHTEHHTVRVPRTLSLDR